MHRWEDIIGIEPESVCLLKDSKNKCVSCKKQNVEVEITGYSTDGAFIKVCKKCAVKLIMKLSQRLDVLLNEE